MEKRMSKEIGVYGLGEGSRAWQPIVGCDPHMSCAPRCWARKTVARVVECQRMQHPRSEFFQQALTPDGKQWSGKIRNALECSMEACGEDLRALLERVRAGR